MPRTNAKRQFKTKPSGRPQGRDWDALRLEYYRSLDNLKQFCKRKKINLRTGRAYFKAKNKREWLADEAARANDEKRKVVESVAKNDPSVLLSALNKSHAVSETIMDLASKRFQALHKKGKDGGGFASAGDAGRLALAAAADLHVYASDLQGIPDVDAEEGWPLSRGFRPHWYQRDFIFDLPSATGFILFPFIAGIGSGKTRCGAEKFGDLCWLNRGIPHVVAAPTYRMLEDTTKAMFLDTIHEKDLTYVYKKTDNKIILFGDTPIMFRSLDKPNHLRGPTLGGVWIDEGGQMRDDTGFKILQGRVRHPGARERFILMTTTPDGLNWLKEKLDSMIAKSLCKIYSGKTADNVSLPAGFIDTLDYDERFAKQELEGAFLNVFAGQAYFTFSRQDHVVPHGKIPYQPGLPLILSCDFNVAPISWTVGQLVQGVIYWIDEIYIQGTSTLVAAKEFMARYWNTERRHKAGVNVHGDASGWYAQTSATETDYAIITEVLKSMPAVQIHAGRSHPEVKSRVAAVNGKFRNMQGHRKMFVSDKCVELIKDLERVAFKPGTQELDKRDPLHTHPSDSIGYYVEQMFPLKKHKGRYA